jgi:cytochrome c oxidase cbb3-type subunit 3
MRYANKILLAAVMLMPGLCLAATGGTDKEQHYNITLITLVGLMLVLVLVIGALAYTLAQLGIVVKDKALKDKKQGVVPAVAMLLLASAASLTARAQEAAAPMVDAIDGIPEAEFYTLMTVIVLEILVIVMLSAYINQLLKVLRAKPELVAEVAAKKSWFWDKFNKAASIEKEKDILLDHDYDGIQELDNSLPPWWLYGFYLTIFVGIIYVYRYHIAHTAPSSEEEFVMEMEKGEEEKAAYLAKAANNVDENSVVALTDAAALAKGKEMYLATCAACHVADGGGSVGPNLTDEYWLHGGGIKDIFKSIKYGWQEKGMKSWKDDYSPMQMQQIASFIVTLKGTHPAAPKAPQGEVYIAAAPAAGAAPAATPADSTKTN